MRIFGKREAEKGNEAEKERVSAQDWMNLASVFGQIVTDKSGAIWGALRVTPINISLLSEKEQERLEVAITAQLNGETWPLEIFKVDKPIDLNAEITRYDQRVRGDSDVQRRRVLIAFRDQAIKIMQSGEILEKMIYVIYRSDSQSKKAQLLEKLAEMQSRLKACDITSAICEDHELIEMMHLLTNPIVAGMQTQYGMFDLPPVLARR